MHCIAALDRIKSPARAVRCPIWCLVSDVRQWHTQRLMTMTHRVTNVSDTKWLMTVTHTMAVLTFYKLIRLIDTTINTCVQFVLSVLNTEALDRHNVPLNTYLVPPRFHPSVCAVQLESDEACNFNFVRSHCSTVTTGPRTRRDRLELSHDLAPSEWKLFAQSRRSEQNAAHLSRHRQY